MEIQNLSTYAEDALAEEVLSEAQGFLSVEDAISLVEDCEGSFDGDSYCPYYAQHEEVISRYEPEFDDAAQDYTGGEKYEAGDWYKARAEWAYALAAAGFSSYFQTAKEELTEALEGFESEAQSELKTEQEIQVQLTSDCPHGWAAHDRELEDGTMIWKSGQLDGCNGMAQNVAGVWISCCITPEAEASTL